MPNDTVGPNAGTFLSKQREFFLNRELWDVRRQITALRARETKILDELDYAPEPVESLAAKNGSSEDKSKAMEAENCCTWFALARGLCRVLYFGTCDVPPPLFFHLHI